MYVVRLVPKDGYSYEKKLEQFYYAESAFAYIEKCMQEDLRESGETHLYCIKYEPVAEAV